LEVALVVGAAVSKIDQVVTTEGRVPMGVQGCELVKEHTLILVHQHCVILVEVAEKGLVVEHGLHKVISGSGALHTPPYVCGGRGLAI
jgi:hypothetical protein